MSHILSHAPLYHSSAARLTSLNDVPVPETSLSASLISNQPRIAAASATAERQDRELAALRTASAQLVSRWHSLGVVGMGECWAEWENRLTIAERAIRQESAKRDREYQDGA